jgi:hypothetical protein
MIEALLEANGFHAAYEFLDEAVGARICIDAAGRLACPRATDASGALLGQDDIGERAGKAGSATSGALMPAPGFHSRVVPATR